MAVEKVFVCDLCGVQCPRSELTRLGVRGYDDRPEDADYVDVGPCCQVRPVSEVITIAADMRKLATDG